MATVRNIITAGNITKISRQSLFNDTVEKGTPLPTIEDTFQQVISAFDKKISSLARDYKEQQEYYKAKKEYIEIVEKIKGLQLPNFDIAPVFTNGEITKWEYKQARRNFDTYIKDDFRKFISHDCSDYLEEIGVSKYLIDALEQGIVFQESLNATIDHKIEIAIGGNLLKSQSADFVNDDFETDDINHFTNLAFINDSLHQLKNRLMELQFMVLDKRSSNIVLTLAPKLTPEGSNYVYFVDKKTSEEFGIDIKSDDEVARDMISYLSSQPKHMVLFGKRKALALRYITAELKSQTKALTDDIENIDKIRQLHEFYKNPELYKLYRTIKGLPLSSVQKFTSAMSLAKKLILVTNPIETLPKPEKVVKERVKKARKNILFAPKAKDIPSAERNYSFEVIRKIDKYIGEFDTDKANLSKSLLEAYLLTSKKDLITLYKSVEEKLKAEKKPSHEDKAFYNAYRRCLILLKRNSYQPNKLDNLRVGINGIVENLLRRKAVPTTTLTRGLNRIFDKAEYLEDCINLNRSVVKKIYKSALINQTYNSIVSTNGINAVVLQEALNAARTFLTNNGVKAKDLIVDTPKEEIAKKVKTPGQKQPPREPKQKLSRRLKKLIKKQQEAEAKKAAKASASLQQNTAVESAKANAEKDLPIDKYIEKKIKLIQSQDNANDSDLKNLYEVCMSAKETYLGPQVKRSAKSHIVEAAINKARIILEPHGFEFGMQRNFAAGIKPISYKKKYREAKIEKAARTVSKDFSKEASVQTPKEHVSKSKEEFIELKTELYDLTREAKKESFSSEDAANLYEIYIEIINHKEFKSDIESYAKNGVLRKAERVLEEKGFVLPDERLTNIDISNHSRRVQKKKSASTHKEETVALQNDLGNIVLEKLKDTLKAVKESSEEEQVANLNNLCEVYNDVVNSNYSRIKKDDETIKQINTALKTTAIVLKVNGFVI